MKIRNTSQEFIGEEKLQHKHKIFVIKRKQKYDLEMGLIQFILYLILLIRS